jgi:hypothetical protein
MKKFSYNYTPLTKNSVSDGELEIGDSVTSTREIKSTDDKYSILPGDIYKVKGFLPNQNPYKGGFIIDFNGQPWGFYFNGGQAEYFNKVEMSKQDIMETRYEGLPYKILTTLTKHNFLSLKELIDTIVDQQMSVPPESIKKVKNELTRAIYSLQSLGLIGVTKITGGEGKVFAVTEKGRRYLNE